MSVYDGDLTGQASAYAVQSNDSNTMPAVWASGLGGIDNLFNGGHGYEYTKDMIDRIYNEQQLEQAREWQVRSDASARRWEEYFDSTKYRRMVADLKAAGLNPWLAINSLSGSSVTNDSTGVTSSYKQSKMRDHSGKDLFGQLVVTALSYLLMSSLS